MTVLRLDLAAGLGTLGHPVEELLGVLVEVAEALAACRTEVYSMIANDSFVGANVHRTRDRAQSALLRSPIELASRCLACI